MKKNKKGTKLIGPRQPRKGWTRRLRRQTQYDLVGGPRSREKGRVHDFRDEDLVIASVFYTYRRLAIDAPPVAGIDPEMSKAHEITYGELRGMSARTFLGGFFSRPGALRFYEVYMCFSRDARSEKELQMDRVHSNDIFEHLWEAKGKLDPKPSPEDVGDILRTIVEAVDDFRRPKGILRPSTSPLSSDAYETREGAAGRRVMMNPDNGIVPRLSWEELKIHRASQYAGLDPSRAALGELAPFEDACGYILMETEDYGRVIGIRLYIEVGEHMGKWKEWLDAQTRPDEEEFSGDLYDDRIDPLQGGPKWGEFNMGFYLHSGVIDDVDFAPRYTVQDVLRQVVGKGKDPAGGIDWEAMIEEAKFGDNVEQLLDDAVPGIVMYNIRETYRESLIRPPYVGAVFFESYFPIIVKVGSAVTEPSLLQPFDEEEAALEQPFIAWRYMDRRDVRGRLARSLFDPQSTIASADFRDEPVIRDRTVTLWFRVRMSANEFDTPATSADNRAMFHGRSGEAMLSEIFADDVVPVEYYRDAAGDDPEWSHAAMENVVLWNRKTPGPRRRQVVDPDTGKTRTLSEPALWTPAPALLDMNDGEAIVYGVGVPILSVKSFGSMIRDDYDYARANKNPACLSVYRTAVDATVDIFRWRKETASVWDRMPVLVRAVDYRKAQALYKRLTTHTSPSHALVLETSKFDAHADTVLGQDMMNQFLLHILMIEPGGHENLELVTEPLPPLPVRGFSLFGNLLSRFSAVGQDIASPMSPEKRPTGKDPTSVFDLL